MLSIFSFPDNSLFEIYYYTGNDFGNGNRLRSFGLEILFIKIY